MAAVFGVPVRFSEVVELDGFAVIPAGRLPETMDHAYGVQPPLALMTPEYSVPTVPFGRVVVVMTTSEPKHCVVNKNSNREGRQSFITPCCRDYKIPDSPGGFGTTHLFFQLSHKRRDSMALGGHFMTSLRSPLP